MALRDRIAEDIGRVFMNQEHFADVHYWDGAEIVCVVDDETALKRKNNNVKDISWDNNTGETLIYTPAAGFPGGRAPEPNSMVMFDGVLKRVLQVQADMGVYTIMLASNDVRMVGMYED